MAETPGLAGQISTPLPGDGLVLSNAATVEEGARVALLLAPGRFRIDVQATQDTLRLLLRHLADEPYLWQEAEEPRHTISATTDLLESLRPTAHAHRFEVDGRRVDVLITATHELDRGRVHVVGQASVLGSPR